MHTKISITGVKARDKVIRGADYLADSVKQTLGPFGLNALLENGNRPTNDGYTISGELANTLEDEFERRGAIALHEACAKTNDEVGDATTSSEVLTQAILKEATKFLPSEKTLVSKKKPSEVVKMIEDSRLKVLKELEKQAKPVESEKELIQIAKVSSENDELAHLIGKTQWKIGKYGSILVEEVNLPESSIEIVKGIRIDNGFGTPYVVTNEKEQSLELPGSSIILTNHTLQTQAQLQELNKNVFQPLLAQKKNAIVIIARAFSSEVIQLCLDSTKKGFGIFPINAPYTYQGEIMRDLAAITGATYYDLEEKEMTDMRIEDVGWASKIIAKRFYGIITGIEDKTPLAQEAVNKRVKQLKDRLNGDISDFDRKFTEQRIAQFEGGFAILRVGAETAFERKYKKDKADDCVNSVRLALQSGVVKGAGLAFKEISNKLADDDILKRPLLSIYNQIISSAPEGFEIEEWVKDPLLTLKSALTNACSVASQLATINTVITTRDKKPKNEDDE